MTTSFFRVYGDLSLANFGTAQSRPLVNFGTGQSQWGTNDDYELWLAILSAIYSEPFVRLSSVHKYILTMQDVFASETTTLLWHGFCRKWKCGQ